MKRLIFIFIISVTSLCAVENSQKIADIDKLISLLHKQVYEIRLKAYELEIDAQQNFFVNWEEYSDKMKDSEKLKNQASELEKNIVKLEKDRTNIINTK